MSPRGRIDSDSAAAESSRSSAAAAALPKHEGGPSRSGDGGSARRQFISMYSRMGERIKRAREGVNAKKLCNKATFYLLLWFMWMVGGTLYYCYENDLGLAVGFYQAVNIGYSIGYGYPREPMEQNWWFSSAYVVLGASFVGVALGFFADKIVEDSQDWFLHMLEKQQYEQDTAPERPFYTRVRAFVRYNWTPIRAILIWAVWVLVMIAYSMIAVRWPFSQAQYYAVSTCSTGGHMSIPDDSPPWLFAITGVFAAIGVPVMGVAMASLGSLLMESREDLDDMKKVIEADVTAEELLQLQRFGLEDGDGEIDRAEYVILCMVRLGTDPRLVQFISQEFRKMDDDNSNSLSILEITRGRVSSDDLQKLGQSEAYMAKRRLSGSIKTGGMKQSISAVSLSSILEENVAAAAAVAAKQQENPQSPSHDADIETGFEAEEQRPAIPSSLMEVELDVFDQEASPTSPLTPNNRDLGLEAAAPLAHPNGTAAIAAAAAKTPPPPPGEEVAPEAVTTSGMKPSISAVSLSSGVMDVTDAWQDNAAPSSDESEEEAVFF